MDKDNNDVVVRHTIELIDQKHCSRCGDELDVTSHEISQVFWQSRVEMLDGKTFIFNYQKNLCAKCTEDLKDWANLEENDERD